MDFIKVFIAAVLFMVFWVFALFAISPKATASRDSCECRELRAIRQLLQHHLGVVCDERRCLPVPTPTVPTGGPLE
jgi:hypothetical protein